ncbi:hypothetical protein E2C01_033474 [Portunus trituberculatus]|uniref:Uncharacterized protein n=1 Tax=Portunus trituberculatus TaxID=210409 RepID=A0A5B7EYS1_PORTR|nr:hypothetical protein [Portunus trituberculatus]
MKLGVLCLLLCLASAQKHEATDEASKEADQWTSDEDTSLRAAASHAPSHALSSEEDDDDDLDLDSEEEPREASEKSKVDTEDHYVYEYDDMDDMSRAYGIVRSSPGDGDVPSTSGRKSKTGRRETKRKLPKDLKWEIAEYALQYGTRQAVHHYSQQVGKRISEKKIEKFVRRYQQRQERVEARQN